MCAHGNVDVSVVCPVADFFSLLPNEVSSLWNNCEPNVSEGVVPFMKISNSKILVTQSKGSHDLCSELFVSFFSFLLVCVSWY